MVEGSLKDSRLGGHLVHEMLKKAPAERFTAGQALDHVLHFIVSAHIYDVWASPNDTLLRQCEYHMCSECILFFRGE